MGEATEIVFFDVKDGITFQDKRFQSVMETIIKRGKPLRMYYGGQIEKPKVHNLFIDWNR
jgi:hypothetical protein